MAQKMLLLAQSSFYWRYMQLCVENALTLHMFFYRNTRFIGATSCFIVVEHEFLSAPHNFSGAEYFLTVHHQHPIVTYHLTLIPTSRRGILNETVKYK
ncbi:hypothetical protein [Sporosarcina contaminans]|uniref:hypothetical protein n=1 Tax=Sporosarcina contaminans TaxID=633403 RepID=UPI0036D4207F